MQFTFVIQSDVTPFTVGYWRCRIPSLRRSLVFAFIFIGVFWLSSCQVVRLPVQIGFTARLKPVEIVMDKRANNKTTVKPSRPNGVGIVVMRLSYTLEELQEQTVQA